ncbi:MAG: hypothetical protein ACJ0A2_08230 [Alphaproteobacteria bacterium]
MKLFKQHDRYTIILMLIVIILGLAIIVSFFIVVATIVYRGIQLAL